MHRHYIKYSMVAIYELIFDIELYLNDITEFNNYENLGNIMFIGESKMLEFQSEVNFNHFGVLKELVAYIRFNIRRKG